MDDYYSDIPKPDTPVSDYNLQAYVPVPSAGALPVKEISNREDMVVRVVWKDAEGRPLEGDFAAFVLGSVYQADITLTTKKGFTFDPLIRFSYPVNAVETQSADNSTGERILSIVYKITEVPLPIEEEPDLTAHIPVPVMGGSPVTSFYAGTFGGMVVWEAPNRAAVTGLFQAGTVYTAKAALYPAPGYTLVGSSFTYTGGGELNPSDGWSNTGSALTGMTVTFPATTTVAAAAVNDLDLTYKLPVPVRGGTPVTYFSAPQYTGRVDWLVGGSEAPHSVFQPNMAYTAKVTLTAASGYTLGYPAVNFTHGGAALSAAENGNGTVTVSAAFPATTAAAAIPVNDLNLTNYIPAPVRNGTPVRYFSAPQYTGNVAWTAGGQSLSDLFEANTAYTAVVTLTAASGYTFTGAPGAFSHGGAELITHLNGTTVRVRFGATTDAAVVQVNDLDLTGRVPAPVRGGTPVSYFSAPQYTGNVAWSVTAGGQALGGLFEAGTAYTATVSLTAVSGYTFTGVGANAFTCGGAAGTTVNAANTGVVTIAFPATSGIAATAVDDLDLTYKLPAPVRGGTPVTYISAPQYTGTVDWFVGGTSAPHSVFQANMAYTAVVTLTAAGGYTFGYPVVTFTHAGTSAVTTAPGAAVTVTVPFPATTGVAAVTVSDLDLTYRVPAPVNGGTPVAYVSAPQYTGSVAWKRTDNNAALSGLFGANTAYTATVTLTAVSGYTFAGVGANGFTYTGGPAAINSADSGEVTITFPPTGSVAAAVVNNMDLTYHVSAPVRGGTPVRYVSDPQYTGIVVWTVTPGGQTLNGLFEGGTAYTATVSLTAASGRTFSGVGANAFNHAGKSAISNGAGSGTVVIAFPATAAVTVTPISSVDLTNVLPAPITGASPLMSFNDGTYSGTAAWTTSGGTVVTLFEVGTMYTATVTLYPTSGYSFPASLPVTHGGITIANFTGEPRRGTITFPPTGILSFFNGPFSGRSAWSNDSAVDMIKTTHAAGHPSLYLQLAPRTDETVDLGAGDRDIGAGGLVLSYNDSTPGNNNSPPVVVIDGGGRVITTTTIPLIVARAGVTLTLRNITIIGPGKNELPPVQAEATGKLLLETGVSLIYDGDYENGTLSGFTTRLDSAIDVIRGKKQDNEESVTVNLSPGTEVVKLNNTTDIGTGLVLNSTNSPAEVTINGNGRIIQQDSNTKGALLTVGAGVTLTLQNITLKGTNNQTSPASSSPFVVVNSGGHLILETGAVITGCYETFGLTIAGGTVTLDGGEIISNTGVYGGPGSGGVTMSSGSLTLNSGKINNNQYADGRGGGVVMSGGTFTMYGGEIRGNYARDGGGGVYITGGAFTMWGGLISGNSIQFNSGGQFLKAGGTAQWNQNSDGALVDLGTTGGAISLPDWPSGP
jgi:hypothetical protein